MLWLYHGTSENNWNQIQKDGYLFGITENGRFTYLSIEPSIALSYGSVLLEVNYDINKHPELVEKLAWWQYIIHEPINITKIKRLL